jgi:Protein of unknown function (DUF3999)
MKAMSLAAAALGLASLAASPLPSAWRHWRYSRAVVLPATEAPVLASFVLPEDVYALESRPEADLRIMDDRADEVPYFIYSREGSSASTPTTTILHEKSFTPGQFTQLLVEIPGTAPFHNSLQIFTPEQNFMEWVRVEASDDARTWRIVQERAPIFRFRNQGREGIQKVQYSENNANFLRVSVLDGQKEFPLTNVIVSREISVPAERVAMSADLVPASNSPAAKSVWTADLGGTHAAVSEVRFEASEEFSRVARVEASEDNQDWEQMAQGEIFKFRQGDAVQERLSLSISYADPKERFWRVEIENGNDSPLLSASPHFYTTPRHVVFRQQPGRSYRFLYGQSEAKFPRYDLGRRIGEKERDSAISATLGPEEENSGWSDPRPFTERYSFVLWILVGIAVLMLGYSAIRSLRRSGPGQPAT